LQPASFAQSHAAVPDRAFRQTDTRPNNGVAAAKMPSAIPASPTNTAEPLPIATPASKPGASDIPTQAAAQPTATTTTDFVVVISFSLKRLADTNILWLCGLKSLEVQAGFSQEKITSMCAMSIGELARLTATPVATIRYYEEIGLLPAAARGRGGQRMYDPQDVERLRFVRSRRDLGFAISDV
jgi:MerR HTH family regulatory protein